MISSSFGRYKNTRIKAAICAVFMLLSMLNLSSFSFLLKNVEGQAVLPFSVQAITIPDDALPGPSITLNITVYFNSSYSGKYDIVVYINGTPSTVQTQSGSWMTGAVQYITSIQVNMPEPRTYRLEAILTGYINQVAITSEPYVFYITMKNYADLYVDPSRILFDNSYVDGGTNITASAVVGNKGERDVSNANVTFSIMSGDYVVETLTTVKRDLPAGSTSTITNIIIPTRFLHGNYKLLVNISAGALKEITYLNNNAYRIFAVFNTQFDKIVDGTGQNPNWTIDTPYNFDGFLIIKKYGGFNINGGTVRFIEEWSDQFSILVEDFGTLRIANSTVFGDYNVTIRLSRNATLWIEGSTLGSFEGTNISIVAQDNSMVYIMNSAIAGAIDIRGTVVHISNSTIIGKEMKLNAPDVTITRSQIKTRYNVDMVNDSSNSSLGSLTLYNSEPSLYSATIVDSDINTTTVFISLLQFTTFYPERFDFTQSAFANITPAIKVVGNLQANVTNCTINSYAKLGDQGSTLKSLSPIQAVGAGRITVNRILNVRIVDQTEKPLESAYVSVKDYARNTPISNPKYTDSFGYVKFIIPSDIITDDPAGQAHFIGNYRLNATYYNDLYKVSGSVVLDEYPYFLPENNTKVVQLVMGSIKPEHTPMVGFVFEVPEGVTMNATGFRTNPYIVTGFIIINGTYIIRNTTFILDSPNDFQYLILIQGNGKLILENSTLYGTKRFNIYIVDSGSLILNNSTIRCDTIITRDSTVVNATNNSKLYTNLQTAGSLLVLKNTYLEGKTMNALDARADINGTTVKLSDILTIESDILSINNFTANMPNPTDKLDVSIITM
ncbi:MAG: hypothetical protein QW728_03100, partial [Thermoplasmata archaeon]